MADDEPLDLSDLTPGDAAKLAWYSARMAKRGLAGPEVYLDDLKRKMDRVLDQARKRKNTPKK